MIAITTLSGSPASLASLKGARIAATTTRGLRVAGKVTSYREARSGAIEIGVTGLDGVFAGRFEVNEFASIILL